MNIASYLSVNELIERYDRELCWVLFRRLRNVDAVADLLQETYQRMFAQGLVQTAQNPRVLLYRIASNLATDYERSQRVRSRHPLQFPEAEAVHCPLPLPDRAAEAAERFALLLHAVNRLPPRGREIFVLRNFEDLSQADIAKRLQISVDMVGRHLRYALKFCHTALERDDA